MRGKNGAAAAVRREAEAAQQIGELRAELAAAKHTATRSARLASELEQVRGELNRQRGLNRDRTSDELAAARAEAVELKAKHAADLLELGALLGSTRGREGVGFSFTHEEWGTLRRILGADALHLWLAPDGGNRNHRRNIAQGPDGFRKFLGLAHEVLK